MKRRQLFKISAALGVTPVLPAGAQTLVALDATGATTGGSGTTASIANAAGAYPGSKPMLRAGVNVRALSDVTSTLVARDASKEVVFQGLLNQFLAAASHKQLNTLEAMYGKDPKYRFADADGSFHHGWAGSSPADRGGYRQWLTLVMQSQVKSQSFRMSDLELVKLGTNIYLTTCKIDAQVTGQDDHTANYAMRLSFLWHPKREGSSYEIVHEHFSVQGT